MQDAELYFLNNIQTYLFYINDNFLYSFDTEFVTCSAYCSELSTRLYSITSKNKFSSSVFINSQAHAIRLVVGAIYDI
jgi:hypothetical protein